MHSTCRASGDQYPDMIVVSTGLWHMLHIGSPEGFQSAVTQLKQQSESLVNKPVCATTDLGHRGVCSQDTSVLTGVMCCKV